MPSLVDFPAPNALHLDGGSGMPSSRISQQRCDEGSAHCGCHVQPALAQERERKDSANEEAAAGACADGEDDRQSLCQMSDSACSLNGEGEAAASAQEAWLVQEYCSLGTLQVAPAPCPAMQSPSSRQHSAPCRVPGPAKHPAHRQPNRGPSWAWPASLRRASRVGQSNRSHRVRAAVQLAIAQGRFQKASGRPLSAAILDVALDVAAAMAALHARAAPHGNLCSASVLLTPSSVQLSPAS